MPEYLLRLSQMPHFSGAEQGFFQELISRHTTRSPISVAGSGDCTFGFGGLITQATKNCDRENYPVRFALAAEDLAA
jgi:hypothetical protein